MKLKQIIESNDTRTGKTVDLFIQVMIVLSLISFSIETLPDLSEKMVKWLGYLETVTVAVFTIEYVLRIAVADKKMHYILSFYGLIDIVAILPFYLSTGIDLRSIRIFRLFRLFRAFKLLQFSTAANRLGKAFLDVKDEFIIFLMAAMFVLYVSAVGIYYFENEVQPEAFKSVFHCLWWAVATLTTVGYGDVYPITAGGKIFASVIVFIGLGIVAVPTGLIASSLTASMKNTDDEERSGL
ncbi:MAG: ion transporter [Candidatus Marinimicrobia bacterium]|nr:ion transporter [Candidatus Neomarinimicrobiota bacterium]